MLIRVIPAIVLLIPLTCHAKEYLSGDELERLYGSDLVLTQTLVFAKSQLRGSVYEVRFESSGKLTGDHINCSEIRQSNVCMKGGKWDEGKWRIDKANSRLCMKWSKWHKAKDRCFSVQKIGDEYQLFGEGKVNPFLKHKFD